MSRPRVVSARDPRNLKRAAAILRAGGLVAFPTETVYGLGADATNARAALKIFEAKRRPLFDPLIVHCADASSAFALCREAPRDARRLAKAFWPGPLTLVLPKKAAIPDVVTSGLDTVAVRVPASPAARRLLRAAGRPIAAPSANQFGRTSATTAEMVRREFPKGPALILDGGPCRVGVESTVVRVSKRGCEILRPGGVPIERLRKVVRVRRAPSRASSRLSPGRLKSHYAPRTPLFIAPLRPERLYARVAAAAPPRAGFLAFRRGRVPAGFAASAVLSRSGSVKEAASRLFQALHELDRMGLDFIVAERVPETGLGEAVADRLRRASSPVSALREALGRKPTNNHRGLK